MIKYGSGEGDISQSAEGHTEAVKAAASNARSALESDDCYEIPLSAMVERTVVETDRYYRKRRNRKD